MLIFYPANFILDQWNKIIEQLGTPSQDFMRRLQEHILTIKKTIVLRKRHHVIIAILFIAMAFF